jgi:site-specific recombinase XerD
MSTYVVGRVQRVESQFRDSEFKTYLDSFKFDCQLRNLSQKTIDAYFERLSYFFLYLQDRNIDFISITKKVIQQYIFSLKGQVSD